MRLQMICMLAVFFTGCQHSHLKYNAVRQGETLSEIYEQQVLNNLAMIVRDPHGLPSFAYPKDGTVNIQDGGSFGAAPLNQFRTVVGIGGSRAALGQWGLTPVCEPEKLSLMLAAYQQAVYGKILDPCNDAGESGYPHKCCITCGWLCHGSKHDAPCDSCVLIGEDCGVYTWVKPQHRHNLTRLTLRILDYAVNEPQVIATREKKVTININKNFKATSEASEVVGTVEGIIAINDNPVSILQGTTSTSSNDENVSPPAATGAESSTESSNASKIVYPRERTVRPVDGGLNQFDIQRRLRSLGQ